MLADKPDALAPRPLAGAGSGRCARPCGGAGASPRLARAARDKLAGEGGEERVYVERIDRFLAAKP